MSMLAKAIAFATRAHEGQTDKSGAPYIFHPVRVASTFSDDVLQTIAVLHDVIEDCDVTYSDLSAEFSTDVADAVQALTRGDDEPYFNFIRRAAKNPLAKLVKIADIRDNLRPGAEHLRPRYEQALRMLDAAPESPCDHVVGWTKVPEEPPLEFLKSINANNQVLAYEDGRYYNAWFEFEASEGGWFWTDDADSEPNPSYYRLLNEVSLSSTEGAEG